MSVLSGCMSVSTHRHHFPYTGEEQSLTGAVTTTLPPPSLQFERHQSATIIAASRPGRAPQPHLARRAERLVEGLELAQGLVHRTMSLRLHRHECRQHRQPLRRRQAPVTPPPILSLALDLLAVREVAPRITRPMHPVRFEVEPHLLWFITCSDTAPATQPLIVQRVGITPSPQVSWSSRTGNAAPT